MLINPSVHQSTIILPPTTARKRCTTSGMVSSLETMRVPEYQKASAYDPTRREGNVQLDLLISKRSSKATYIGKSTLNLMQGPE